MLSLRLQPRSRYLRALLAVALALVVADSVSTIIGASIAGVGEINPFIVWMRAGLGVIGAQAVFDAIRVTLIMSAYTVATSATSRWRIVATIILAGFCVLALPVVIGNFRMIAWAR